MANRVLIIGAGHAGGTAAALLRQYGHEGPIVLAGEEPAAPYQRPPLSKAWLKGEADLEALLLRPESFYAEHAIELRTGVTATGIDRAARTVAFADGTVEPYDALILATGSTARRLAIPGADRPELMELRTLADAERLKAALGPGRRLAIVGGGYVGLEAAASARALGAEAVVIERMDRVLARVASEALSTFFTARHRSEGVEILTGAEVTAFQDAGVRLADGRLIEADAVLVGVGALAADDLARAAGLDCGNGVVVDEHAQTSDPAIWAVGDMTFRPIPVHGGRRHRLESVPNALEQAKQAASAIVGRAAPTPEVPWFWSDQYDLKLQIAGLPDGADRQVVRGDPGVIGDGASFAVFHLQGDRILCVEAVNAPAEFMAGRMMIGKATPVDAAKLADLSVSMKMVAAG
ncbi:NAD(P)/FAD-dependent oxidoreductase [Brevundimonas sp. Root1423]|uniref:NAD(P)/FAD-dependent oxidoreductase n=1 Tax=Brevundimonas sp. Root1423 TaxID=1736462 RepID=UPI0006F431B9|nr:FAD-dependent oxidoreductase [Brevundimonas sp. Root1423]KQY84899.1 ferredoxin reductase [Brevundimonas sp. Root1423]